MKGLFAFVIIMIGVVSILVPEAMWQLYEGWKFKDA